MHPPWYHCGACNGTPASRSLPSMRRPGRGHYDHRVRQANRGVRQPPPLRPYLRIPPSTARSWLWRRCPPSVSTTENRARTASTAIEFATLRVKAAYYFAIASLSLIVVRTFEFRLGTYRVPDCRDKTTLLRRIELASVVVPRRRLVDLIGLSPNNRSDATSSIPASVA